MFDLSFLIDWRHFDPKFLFEFHHPASEHALALVYFHHYIFFFLLFIIVLIIWLIKLVFFFKIDNYPTSCIWVQTYTPFMHKYLLYRLKQLLNSFFLLFDNKFFKNNKYLMKFSFLCWKEYNLLIIFFSTFKNNNLNKLYFLKNIICLSYYFWIFSTKKENKLEIFDLDNKYFNSISENFFYKKIFFLKLKNDFFSKNLFLKEEKNNFKNSIFYDKNKFSDFLTFFEFFLEKKSSFSKISDIYFIISKKNIINFLIYYVNFNNIFDLFSKLSNCNYNTIFLWYKRKINNLTFQKIKFNFLNQNFIQLLKANILILIFNIYYFSKLIFYFLNLSFNKRLFLHKFLYRKTLFFENMPKTLFNYYLNFILIDSKFNSYLSLKNYRHNVLIEWIWTIIPIIILLILLFPSLILLYNYDKPYVTKPYLTLKVIGNQWFWSYEYTDNFIFFEFAKNKLNSEDNINLVKKNINNLIKFDSYMLDENDLGFGQLRLLDVDRRIILPVGVCIRIITTSIDVLHSWAIPALGIKIDSVPGRLNQFWVVLKKPGVFYGQCSELCGVQHGFMPIVVEGVNLKQYYTYLNTYFVKN